VALPLSSGIRAPVEHLFRSILKSALLSSEDPTPVPSPPEPKIGVRRVLPPYLGEMGYEVRLHLARVEPWLHNGWKIVARRPEFYPPGAAVASPEFFQACDAIMAAHKAVGSFGSIYIGPYEHGVIDLKPQFKEAFGEVVLSLSDIDKVFRQALVEIELRKLFLEWLDHDGRPLNDYDREALSFQNGSQGVTEYRLAESLRPSYRPTAFETPVEPMAPHVGFQVRKVSNGFIQQRNSDMDWMCETARAIGQHLGLPVVAYGHLDGCVIPEGFTTSWDEARGADGHLARELGYLKSCRVMLAPDSGWTDLMAWLGVPVLLEMLVIPSVFDGMRDTFQPRIALVDRDRPIGAQVDALLAADFSLPGGDLRKTGLAKASFPWEP
jgi:hypothetical protein